MLKPVYTKQFEKDLKKVARRGKSIDKIKIILATLLPTCKPSLSMLS